jgi:hypothetical protein
MPNVPEYSAVSQEKERDSMRALLLTDSPTLEKSTSGHSLEKVFVGKSGLVMPKATAKKAPSQR